MQRLLSLKLASNLPKTLSTSTTTTTTTRSSSLYHFQPHKTFSLTKTHTQNNFLSSFPTHSLPYQHKVHGFLQTQLLRKHFSLDCRRCFLQTKFPKQKFQFIPNSNSQESVRRSSWFQRVSRNGMVIALILANVSVFCLWQIADIEFMYKNFTISVYQFHLQRIHTLVTPAFSHIEVGHIVSNMLGLYLYGTNIGRVFGPGFLLKLYLAGGIGGSMLYLLHKAYLSTLPENKLSPSSDLWHPLYSPGLGASGAVTATILLDIFLYPTATFYFFIRVPSVLLGMFLLGQDYLRVKWGGYKYISESTHLGGATVAAIFWVWARLRMGRRLF